MDLRALRRWDHKLVLISAACIFGAAAASYYLWLDYNESGEDGQGPAMGMLVRKEGRVKRKTKSSYVWSNLTEGKNLFHKDTLQTSMDGAAAIRMKDGSVLELGSGSVIKLDNVGDLSLNFLRGQAVIRTAEGDKRVSVDSTGKAKVELLAMRLVKPEPLSELLTTEHRPVEISFAWEPRKQAQTAELPAKYILQVSQDEKFRPGVTKQWATSDARIQSLKTPLEPGRYYWRILGQLANGQAQTLTESAQFRVSNIEALKPTWPNASQKLSTFGADSSVQFRWLAPKGAEAIYGDDSELEAEHLIEVAKDARFSPVLASAEISALAGVGALKGIPAGSLFWRVRSKIGNVTVVSAVERFELSHVENLGLELNSPADGATVPLQKVLRFSWLSESADIEYAWELKDPAGKILASNRAQTLSADWTKPAPGAYQWKVTAFHKGQKLAETPWRKFGVYGGDPIALLKPLPDESFLFWEKPAPVKFEWKPDSLLAREKGLSYQIEVASDPEFTQITGTHKTVTATADGQALKLGTVPGRSLASEESAQTYYWRVVVVDSSGQTIKKSSSRKLVYGNYPLLRAPASAQPEANTEFNLLEQEADPTLGWAPVVDATGYEVTISVTDPATKRSRVVLQTMTTKTAIILKGVRPGSYSWTVKPVDRMNRRGEALAPRAFKVSHGELLPAPELTSPEVQ